MWCLCYNLVGSGGILFQGNLDFFFIYLSPSDSILMTLRAECWYTQVAIRSFLAHLVDLRYIIP